EPLRLTVMTYNLHHCEGIDKNLDVERIARVIVSVKPDLVALQEVDRNTNRTGHVDQAALLAKLTKMHGFFGKAMDYDGGEYGDAVLSRFDVKDSRIVALPYKPLEKHEPRAAVAIRCQMSGRGSGPLIRPHLAYN